MVFFMFVPGLAFFVMMLPDCDAALRKNATVLWPHNHGLIICDRLDGHPMGKRHVN
jgi:hypothetical protein